VVIPPRNTKNKKEAMKKKKKRKKTKHKNRNTLCEHTMYIVVTAQQSQG